MVLFAGGRRVEDRPTQWLPVHLDPAADRERVSTILRARALAESPPYEPWPAPEVPMRAVEPGALRGTPARLLSKLRSADWRAVVTYARGTTFDAQRRPGAVIGSWALRASKGNRRMVAIWWERTPGKLQTKGVLVWGDRPAQWVGVSEFEEEI